MVPDSSLTRRSLLAGAGTALGAGLVGVGWVAPTWLPDAVTDELLRAYPEPPSHVWRPEMSDEHADEAVALLAATVERAERLRARVDVDSLPEDLAFHLDGGDPSGGWLESARETDDPHERLFYATYGMGFAGETVGYAKVALDEVDVEALVERGAELRAAADEVRDSMADYLVSDPATDLAYVYAAERALAFARLNSHRGGTFTGDAADADDYSAHDVASTHGSHVEARQRLRNARYYRGLYRERLGDDARPAADVLSAAVTELTEAVKEYRTRGEMQTRLREELDLSQRTPYGAARWELFTLCYDNDFRTGFDEEGYRPGHTVQRLVETSLALMERRAHEFARSELDLSPEDEGYDSGRAFRAKRRAVRTFRDVRAEYDSPLAGLLAQEPADRIRAGDIGVGAAWDRDDARPPWVDRAEATTYYLVGEGMLRELGAVFGRIDAASGSESFGLRL